MKPMKPRLLLVEDDPISREFLRVASAALPIEVDCADNVGTAIGLARTNHYALWLIDAHLPDGSGATLLAELRAFHGGTPAIAHTASRSPDDLAALRAAGFDDAVTKPLPATEWQEILRRHLPGLPAPAPPSDAAQDRQDASLLPVWDEARALSALKGNPGHVQALRRLFLDELPAIRDAVHAAGMAGNHDLMHASLHRMHASCGFVGASRLEAAARMLDASPGSQAALAAFLSAVQDTALSPPAD